MNVEAYFDILFVTRFETRSLNSGFSKYSVEMSRSARRSRAEDFEGRMEGAGSIGTTYGR